MPDATIDSAGAAALLGKAETLVDELLCGETAGSVRDALEKMPLLEADLRDRIPARDDYFDLGYTSEEGLLSDLAWALLFNRLMRPFFEAVPVEDRAIFLPHCLAHSTECRREKKGVFDICTRCGRCIIDSMVGKALEKGYREDRIFILGGGSTLAPIVRKHGIGAVVGVACSREAMLYYNGAVRGEHEIPSQMVLLHRWGCRDTGTVPEWMFRAL